MLINVDFSESEQQFVASLGEVTNVSDGGYERGYATGYSEGETEGYNKGHEDGAQQGYTTGYSDGEAKGYTSGHEDGVQQGYTAGYDAGKAIATQLLERTLTSYSDKQLETIGNSAFMYCTSLEYLDVPNVTTLGQKGLNTCNKLKRLELPKLTTVIPGDNVTYCSVLEYVDFGFATNIPSWCLAHCPKLHTLILRKADSICTLQTTNALQGSGIATGEGFVYVPENLVEQYKNATNWSTYASQIKPLSELEE